MKDKQEKLTVLILTDTIDLGTYLGQAVTMLGHRPDWSSYQTIADIQNEIVARAWDLVVIEGCHRLEDVSIPCIDLSPMKLRLLSDEERIAIIAAGSPGTEVSPAGRMAGCRAFEITATQVG